MLTLDQDLDDSRKVDYQLSNYRAPQKPFLPSAKSDEFHQVETEGNTSEGGRENTCRLSRKFLFHGVHLLFVIQTSKMAAQTPTDRV